MWHSPVRSAQQQPQGRPDAISVRTASVDGLNIQYLFAGRGPTIVLLHGYAETSRMWRPLIPRLSDNFTVIAADLPGIGGSAVPAEGVDMSRAAVGVQALVQQLGLGKAAVVGRGIGLMVAYAYAAQFPSDVEKLVLHGRLSARRRRVGGDLQPSGHLALPFQRADARGAGPRPGADILRAFLERLRRG